MFKLIIYSRIPEELKETLGQYCELKVFESITDKNKLLFEEELKDANGLLGAGLPISEELIQKAPKLCYVGNISAGYDNFNLDVMTKHGVVAVNAPNALSDTTADLIFSLLLSSARRVTELDRYMRRKQWQGEITKENFGVNVHHKTLGIIGMGRIGKAVAQRAALGFDMKVLYNKRTRDEEAEDKLGVTYAGLPELLQSSDFVCVTLPLTDDTYHFIGEKEIHMMKPSAILVNGGRGPIVDEKALIKALEQKIILGAGLDVFEKEPLPLDSRLLELENVVLAPHIGSATEETRTDMAKEAVQNLLEFIDGNKPSNLLNPDGYEHHLAK